MSEPRAPVHGGPTEAKSQRGHPPSQPSANTRSSRVRQGLAEKFNSLVVYDDCHLANFGPWAYDVGVSTSFTSSSSSQTTDSRAETDYRSIDRCSNQSTPRAATQGPQSGADDAPSRQSSSATSYGLDSWDGSGGWSSDASSNRPSPRLSLGARDSATERIRPTLRAGPAAGKSGSGNVSNDNRSGPAGSSNVIGGRLHGLMRRRSQNRGVATGEKETLDEWVTDIKAEGRGEQSVRYPTSRLTSTFQRTGVKRK